MWLLNIKTDDKKSGTLLQCFNFIVILFIIHLSRIYMPFYANFTIAGNSAASNYLPTPLTAPPFSPLPNT